MEQHERPPPYPQEQPVHYDFPTVPRSSLSTNDPNSPRHLPALEPTLSHDSQPGPNNPMNARRRSDAGHHDIQYSSGITLQPLRFPQVPEHDFGGLQSPSAMNLDMRSPREHSSSAEALDDRVAAEALLGLGKPAPQQHHQQQQQQQQHHHQHSHQQHPQHLQHDPRHGRPMGLETDLKYYDIVENIRSGPHRDEPEPLLSLLTSSHPWLGGTINSSVSAYSSTKQYTPRFVQRGADLVENTVGAVGRRTGVEGGIRRYLDSRRPSELDIAALNGGHGATKEEQHNNELTRTSTGKESMDSLPAYDSNRSPSYEEALQPQSQSTALSSQQRPPISRSWSTQFMISTSGLGAALNDTSLQSLKYCLAILTRANGHVRNLMDALRRLLSRYAESQASHAARQHHHSQNGDNASSPDAMDVDGRTPSNGGDAAQQQTALVTATSEIANEIRKLNHEIWQTFHNVVDYVSQYTGGALPENASTIVRWQLMSVPGRWHRAARASANSPTSPAQPQTQDGDGERADEPVVSSARRMLAFAIEGLDMMDQVGGVVDSTIVSAEKWLDTMGRRRREEQQYRRDGAVGLPLPVQAQAQGPGKTG